SLVTATAISSSAARRTVDAIIFPFTTTSTFSSSARRNHDRPTQIRFFLQIQDRPDYGLRPAILYRLLSADRLPIFQAHLDRSHGCLVPESGRASAKAVELALPDAGC